MNSEAAEPLAVDRMLKDRRYGVVLTYPRFSPATASRRLSELKRLGVTHLEFEGESQVYGVRILGKGCVGLVVIAHARSGRAALKIRRLDANRSSLRQEAQMLKAANEVGVGPRLYGCSRNFLLMELIEGRLFPYWVQALEGKCGRAMLREALTKLLEDCFRLDEAGIDHGELSRAAKHIMVTPSVNPQILDFESASCRRRASNVTSICQYLLIGSETARAVARLIGDPDRERLIDALKAYKRKPSLEALRRVEESAGLTRFK
ncbi:MAG: serine/threonine protein kinase [Candidatus Bathyarchaeia archaeon]